MPAMSGSSGSAYSEDDEGDHGRCRKQHPNGSDGRHAHHVSAHVHHPGTTGHHAGHAEQSHDHKHDDQEGQSPTTARLDIRASSGD